MKSRFLASLLFAALAVPALAAPTVQGFDNETVGAEPKSFAAAVGNWVIVEDAGNKGLSVNGTKWARGQTSAGLADKARALYGERYAEFLDNVQSYAYFPIAVMNEVADFREGTITVRFKGVDGRIDQAAGILFNVQPNGDDENAPVVKVRSTANLKTEAKKPAQLVGLGAFKSLVGSDYFASGVCAHCNHEKQTHVDGQ